MNVDLKDKVVLVTGAARHIGKAIGDLYLANGAIVVYTDIDFGDGGINAFRSSNSRGAIMDVCDSEQIEIVVAETIQNFGNLDIVVNNAATYSLEHRVTIDAFPREEWDRIVNVDLTGVYLVSKIATCAMLKQGSGTIINVSSVFGVVPARLQCAYVAAKAGVVNLTKAMALELAPRGIRVNCIAPGSILTEATRYLFYGNGDEMSEKGKAMLDHVPLGHPGKPEDIANAALFLAAAESSYINGHCLTVDGGWTAGYARDF